MHVAFLASQVGPATPETLARRTTIETAKWARAIKEAKIEPQ